MSHLPHVDETLTAPTRVPRSGGRQHECEGRTVVQAVTGGRQVAAVKPGDRSSDVQSEPGPGRVGVEPVNLSKMTSG